MIRHETHGVKGFTLIEVVIAIAVLAISLASLFQIIAASRARIAKAEENWHHMHMLTQAAEYVLLHNATVDSIDREFFPYQDYRIDISYDEIYDEQIHEDFKSIEGQLPLELCTIELINLKSSGKETVDKLQIERIIYEDEGLEPE
jgi:prepilin-type N-terminal cleavage/methylation domain-containing protein